MAKSRQAPTAAADHLRAERGRKRRTPRRRRATHGDRAPQRAAITIGTIRKPSAVANCTATLAPVLRSASSAGGSMTIAGTPRKIPVPSASSTPRTAARAAQLEDGNESLGTTPPGPPTPPRTATRAPQLEYGNESLATTSC